LVTGSACPDYQQQMCSRSWQQLASYYLHAAPALYSLHVILLLAGAFCTARLQHFGMQMLVPNRKCTGTSKTI